MAASGLHISISAEKLFDVGSLSVTNSMLTSVIVSTFIILIALAFKATYNPSKAPKGFQNVIEAIVEMLYGMVFGVTQSKNKALQFFPFIATFFIFIVLNNWFGLLPGVGTIGFTHQAEEMKETASLIPQVNAAEIVPVEEHLDESGTLLEGSTETEEHAVVEEHAESEASHEVFVPFFRAGTADLNMTIALALFSQFFAQYFGFSYLGFGYLKKFFNFSNPVMFFVGLLEFVGEFTKIVSYAFRLFGNVFAGEVLLVVISYLAKVVVPMPFYGLELFVGMIQGLVFAMLSLVFFNMATISHEEH
jgi:F-type H+-transporting ATPase subunit a